MPKYYRQAQPYVESHEDHHDGVGEGNLHHLHQGQDHVIQGKFGERFYFYFSMLFLLFCLNSAILRVPKETLQNQIIVPNIVFKCMNR